MRQEKTKDCFHKIVTFQAHRNCQDIAAICQKKCQSQHSTNIPPSYINVEVIHNQFNKIKNRLIESIKLYSDKFSREYEELMKIFQRKYTQNLREMEKQMLNALIRTININKDVLDKIQNDRLEKLKCCEIYTFLEEESNVQRKIKSAALLPIYERHLNSLRQHHKNFNWNLNNEAKPKNIKLNGLIEVSSTNNQFEVQTEQVQRLNQKYIKQLSTASQEIKRLQNELKQLKQSKRNNLSRKTWDLVKVVTKKKLKSAKDNKDKDTIVPFPPPPAPHALNHQMVNESIGNKPQNQMEEIDSEDIIDFIERKKRE